MAENVFSAHRAKECERVVTRKIFIMPDFVDASLKSLRVVVLDELARVERNVN